MYKVYVKTDEIGRIISVNSDAFLPDTDGWEQIDSGDGDKFHHAQGNYFPLPITTFEGVYRYKLVDGKVVERAPAEIAADIAKMPTPPPSAEDRIRALEAKLTALEPTITALTRDTADLKLRLPVVKTLGGT